MTSKKWNNRWTAEHICLLLYTLIFHSHSTNNFFLKNVSLSSMFLLITSWSHPEEFNEKIQWVHEHDLATSSWFQYVKLLESYLYKTKELLDIS